MRHLWGYTYWPWYIIVTASAFLIAEIVALVTDVQNTLSDYAWHELNISVTPGRTVHSAAWLLSQGMYIVMVIWLLFHIWYRQFR